MNNLETKILEEIEDPRLKTNVSVSSTGDYNTGDWNTGDYNTGDRNSGNYNTGDYNSGYWNSGDYNIGSWNSGNCNTGSRNTGNYNTGSRNTGNYNNGCNNTGDHNTGNWNSGYWNSGSCNCGAFNTEKTPKIKMFDKESNWTLSDWYRSRAYGIMATCPQIFSELIDESDMTDEEKEKHPEHKTLGGYLKTCVVTKDDKQKWWDSLSDEEKKEIYNLPNFDAGKFEACTEIKVNFQKNDENIYESAVLDKLDKMITDALDKSTDQKESQTLRWVLDKMSEVIGETEK